MTMKEYSALPRSPVLEPQYQIQFCIIHGKNITFKGSMEDKGLSFFLTWYFF